MQRAVFVVDLQLNPFTREVDQVGRSYDKRYNNDDDNFYGALICGVCENKTDSGLFVCSRWQLKLPDDFRMLHGNSIRPTTVITPLRCVLVNQTSGRQLTVLLPEHARHGGELLRLERGGVSVKRRYRSSTNFSAR